MTDISILLGQQDIHTKMKVTIITTEEAIRLGLTRPNKIIPQKTGRSIPKFIYQVTGKVKPGVSNSVRNAKQEETTFAGASFFENKPIGDEISQLTRTDKDTGEVEILHETAEYKELKRQAEIQKHIDLG